MRSRLKAGLEATLANSGVATLFRRRLRRRRLILAYHGVVPKGERAAGEQSLHVSEADFSAQLEVLGELAQVVPLRELLGAPHEHAALPRVAITWDDAYAGALTAGIDAVVQRGVPALLFVAPGRLGGQSFWWDRLAERFGGTIPEAVRRHALLELGGRDDAVAAAYETGGSAVALPEFACSGGETQLASAAAQPGISVASHSWSHPNLAALAPDEVRQELVSPARWLAERFGCYAPFLAYPYGCHSPTVELEAANAGYAAGLRISGGWMPLATVDPFQIPRLNVPAGLSLDGFVLRLSGLLAR